MHLSTQPEPEEQKLVELKPRAKMPTAKLVISPLVKPQKFQTDIPPAGYSIWDRDVIEYDPKSVQEDFISIWSSDTAVEIKAAFTKIREDPEMQPSKNKVNEFNEFLSAIETALYDVMRIPKKERNK